MSRQTEKLNYVEKLSRQTDKTNRENSLISKVGRQSE